MRSPLTAAVVLGLVLTGPAARAQRVNKLPVRQVEAALILDSGVLRVRLTLTTGEALDYDVREDATITRVLKFIEISATSRMGLAAEVLTDGHTIRALHLVPEDPGPRR